MSKNTICLWYDKDAEAAARFYAATFPDSAVSAVHHAPSDYPGGKEGDVLTVEFTVLGIPCLGLNGGPVFKHNEAFSFQIATEDQEETDRYWNAIVGNGGQESQCVPSLAPPAARPRLKPCRSTPASFFTNAPGAASCCGRSPAIAACFARTARSPVRQFRKWAKVADVAKRR